MIAIEAMTAAIKFSRGFSKHARGGVTMSIISIIDTDNTAKNETINQSIIIIEDCLASPRSSRRDSSPARLSVHLCRGYARVMHVLFLLSVRADSDAETEIHYTYYIHYLHYVTQHPRHATRHESHRSHTDLWLRSEICRADKEKSGVCGGLWL